MLLPMKKNLVIKIAVILLLIVFQTALGQNNIKDTSISKTAHFKKKKTAVQLGRPCSVEIICYYGIRTKIVRYNILVDANKYSKNFPDTITDKEVIKEATDACTRGLLSTLWDEGWSQDCF